MARTHRMNMARAISDYNGLVVKLEGGEMNQDECVLELFRLSFRYGLWPRRTEFACEIQDLVQKGCAVDALCDALYAEGFKIGGDLTHTPAAA